MSFGFNVNEKKVFKDLVINHDFTNAIIFGRTGSGKTTCAILPNIEDRIKSDYGLLIYDFKGNLHLQTKYLANKYNKLADVIEIGKPWGKRINLCDYLNINSLSQIVSNSQDIDNYWNIAAKNLFEVVCTIYKDFNYLIFELSEERLKIKEQSTFLNSIFYKQLSYNQIYKCVNTIESMQEFLSHCKKISKLLKFILQIVFEKESNYADYLAYKMILEKVDELIDSLNFYNTTNVKDNGGKNAVLNHLSSLLIDIAKKDYLNSSSIDIIKELRKGKIIIVDVSTFNENSLNIFNLAIYTRLQKVVNSKMKPVSIFIDEAQKVLNANYLPQVDVCRESKFEYIFATQDEILIENKIGENKFKELFTNIIDKFSFTTNSNDIKNRFEYVDLNSNKKAFANPIFFDKNELIKVEYLFQKENNILKHSDYKSKKDEIYILKYDEKLIEDYKVIIEKMNDIYLETKFVMFPNCVNSKNFINEEDIEEIYILEDIS